MIYEISLNFGGFRKSSNHVAKNLKYFLIPLLLSITAWGGNNFLKDKLTNFFYWHEMAANPILLAAQERQMSFRDNIRNLKPLRDKNVPDLEMTAKSALSILIDGQGRERVLFEKEKNIRLPIASLTKLMTAKIVLDNYDLSKKIRTSKEAIAQEEDFGKLSAGKLLSVEYLLYPLLMESSNDAAYALANDYGGMTEEKFVGLMNKKARDLKMFETQFFNSSGLDIDEPAEIANYSSSLDLARLAENLLEESLIWEILSLEKFDSYGPELININKLLGKIPNMLGGKTGYTEKASGTFLLVMKSPRSKGYIINVILGSEDKFLEMENLINWVNTAYLW